jgi:DNA-binding transcriptional LysR family regulator
VAVTAREVLTLAPVFEAVLSEGSLSRAATRLGVTQSAVSQALSRLRKLTGDELFERTGRGMRPTPRALEMADHIHAALNHVNTAFAPKALDIGTLERTFVLDIGAGFDALILPLLVSEIVQKAPRVRLVVSNCRGGELLNELKYGETELAFDFQANDGDGIRSQLLGRAPAIVLARVGHPALRKGLTKELYLRLPHAALVWTWSPAVSGVKQEQLRTGLEPKITVSVPTVMTLGAVVASSDLIATVSTVMGALLSHRYRLQMHALPFRFAPLALYQLWHARFDADAAHAWLRNTLKALADRQIKALMR